MVLAGRRCCVEGVGFDHGVAGGRGVAERPVLDAVALEVLGLREGSAAIDDRGAHLAVPNAPLLHDSLWSSGLASKPIPPV